MITRSCVSIWRQTVLLVTQLEDLFFVYLEVCDHVVPLVMSPVMQATGWRIVHSWVWLHLMLTFAYSGEPLPTHCSTKFTTVFVALMVSASCGMIPSGFSASSPPSGVTPHSARKVQIVSASGISSELRAHRIAPGGVIAHRRSGRAHYPVYYSKVMENTEMSCASGSATTSSSGSTLLSIP